MSLFSIIKKIRLSPRKIIFSILAFALILVAASALMLNNNQESKVALAANCIWTGNNSGDFSDSGNWDGCGGIPQNGDDITFPDSSNNYNLNNDISGLSLNTLTVESLYTQSYTLSGNNLEVTYGILTSSGSYDFIFDTNTTTCRTEGDGNININSGITYESGCNSYLSYAFDGNIYGSGTFIKNNYWDLALNATVDTVLILDQGSTTVPYGGSLNTTNEVIINNGSVLWILDGPSYFTNYPVTINDGFFQHLTAQDVYVYGLNFTDPSTSRYWTWGNNITSITDSNLDLSNALFDMSWWGNTVGQQTTVLQTLNGYTINGEFANWPSGTNRFFDNGPNTIEASIQYNSDSVVITMEGFISGDCTWTGNNSTDWSDAANWDGCSGNAPVNGKSVIIPSSSNNYSMNNDISGLNLAKLTIESLDNNDYTLSGNNLSVSGEVKFEDSGSYHISFNTSVSSFGVNGSGKFNIESGSIFSVGNGPNFTFSGLIEGQGEFKKIGTGIQSFNDVTTGSSLDVTSESAFLELRGNTQIQGTFNNNPGSGVLMGQSSNNVINNWQGNGGNVNFYPTGSGSPVLIDSANFSSGNFGFDSNSVTNYGQVNFNNGVDLSNLSLSMRFFSSYNIGDSFTIVTSQNGNITGEFNNLPSSSTINAEGWGANSIVSNVEINAVYTNDTVVVTITNIIPFTCSGNVVYTNSSGTVTNGTSNYTPNSNCSWVIAPLNSESVTLNFNAFDTEITNDTVTIYDGITTNGTLLGTFSGNNLPSSVTANSGSMLITFTSNGDTESSGFSADWTSVQIPGPVINSINPSSGPIAGGTAVTLNGANFVSGQYQNISSVGDTGYDGIRGMVVDSSGNQYIAGEFTGSITLGSTTLTSSGNQDIYIAKLNPNNTYAWAVKAGGTTLDGFTRRQSLAIDSSGNNLIIAGYFTNSITFGSTNLTGSSGSNIFISKLNASDGTFVWAKKAGGENTQIFDTSQFPVQFGSSIDIDSSGNIYIAGAMRGVNPTFGSITPTYINNANETEIYIAKLDSSGNFIWVKNYGPSVSNGFAKAHGLKVNSDGDIYTSFSFHQSVQIGATTLTSFRPDGGQNIAVAKLDTNGDPVWALNLGAATNDVTASDLPYDLALDSNENVYITGYVSGANVRFDSINLIGSELGQAVYTAKINPTGTFNWVRLLPSPGFTTARTMYIDTNDKIWIAGGYDNILTDGTKTITGNSTNAFFAQYNTSGDLIELKGISGTGGQLAVTGVGGNQVRALAVYNGNLYIAGEYFNTIGIGGQTITSTGNQDGFYTTWVIDKTSVKINGIEVDADFVSGSQLTFSTPTNTKGQMDIVVTNSDGRSFTLSGAFDYLAPEITNSEISSLVCSPNTTNINTTVDCLITTNLDINSLGGSVNVRIGLSGTVINCPVGVSGTTINCDNVPVGSTEGTLRSQYSASDSGSVYIDGNNITITNNNTNDTNCTGTNTSSNIPGQTTTSVCVESGALTLYAGDSTKNNDICTPANILANTTVDTTVAGQASSTVVCSTDENSISLSGVTTGSKRQFATSIIDDIIFEDLRGYDLSNYTITATVSNFVDPNDTNKRIDLGSNPDSETNEQDDDRPALLQDANKIYAVIDPSTASIAPLRSAGTIAYGTNNYIKGSKVTLIDNVTQVTLLSTSTPTKTGRISLDNVTFKLRIPSFVPAGNFKGTIIQTVI